MGSEGTILYREVCNKAWKEKKVPEDWLIGVITSIHKGDVRNCNTTKEQ